MAISVTKVFDSGQTDHVTNPITLVLGSPIPIGAKALLCNASTIDDAAGISPGASGWGGIDTVTDSRGNTWVRDDYTPVDTVSTFTTVEIFRSDITTALQNGDVLTVTGDTRGLSMEMGILDCRGLAPGGPTQTSGAANISGATSWSSASITTTVPDSLLVGVAGAGSGANAAGWWTPGSGWTEQLDRGDAGTIQRAVAIETQIVAATGTYTATGTASPSSTGNFRLVAYAAASTGQSTGVAQLALGPIVIPDTRTGHEIHVRARKANVSEAGVLRVWLYESSALRSGPWDVGLTDTFTGSTIRIPDNDAALIGSYANLELRIQGVSTSGPITPQVSFIELQTPGASQAVFGDSNFAAFDWPPVRSAAPARFRPGAIIRAATDVSIAQAAGGAQTFPQALTATVASTATVALQVGKLLNATVTTAAQIVKQVAHPLTATVTSTATRVLQVLKPLTATTVTTTTTVQTVKAKLLVLTATTVVTTTTLVKSVGKPLTATLTGTASLVRQTLKGLTATSTTAGSVLKRVNKTFTATTVTLTATVAAVKAFLLALTATVNKSATLVRQVGKAATATVTTSSSVQRQAGKALTATLASTATITRTVAKRLTATVTKVASLVAQFISGGAASINTLFFDPPTPTPDSGEFDNPTPGQERT